MKSAATATPSVDSSPEFYLSLLAEQDKVKAQRIAGVRTVLVVLSARGMVHDVEGLRHIVLQAYPEAAVFFMGTTGRAVGAQAPSSVDLLIDMTGPGQRQGIFRARSLRRRARFAVGRKSGLFRHRIYDRIFDERSPEARAQMPAAVLDDLLERERWAQKAVLGLAGIALIPVGEPTRDLSKKIALDLPPLSRL